MGPIFAVSSAQKRQYPKVSVQSYPTFFTVCTTTTDDATDIKRGGEEMNNNENDIKAI